MKEKICRILLLSLYLFFTAGTVWIFPSISALDNMLHDRQEIQLKPDDINMAVIDQQQSIFGIYLRCEGISLHDICVRSDHRLQCGSVKVYFISREGEEYGEENSFTAQLVYSAGFYRMRMPVSDLKVFGIRLDLKDLMEMQDTSDTQNLTDIQDETRVYSTSTVQFKISEAVCNSRQFSFLWKNLPPWLFMPALLLCLFPGARRKSEEERNRERKLLRKLAANDLKSRYAGSAFGKIWAFVQPLFTVLVMWYVFQIGFRSAPVKNVAFIVWFTSGYVPWMYFSDGLMSMTGSVTDYQFLVKKIRFPTGALPQVRLLSSLWIHMFFMGFLFLVLLIYGYLPELIWIQILYYMVALSMFLTGVGMGFAALSVLFRDCAQAAAVLLQILFWYTPVVWNAGDLSDRMLPAFQANPMFYIIDGYRNTFIDHIWFWEDESSNLRFWVTCAVFFAAGIILFERSRKHFADLL